MNYKELLEQYKANQLDDENKQMLESELEKHSAINDYLFETEELKFEDSEDNENTKSAENTGFHKDRKEDDLIKYVEKSVRRSFMKLGAIVGAIVLVLALTIIYGIPKIQEAIYYNPKEAVGKYSKRIELDFAAYTELFMPGRYRSSVTVNSNGGANYNITIQQTSAYSGQPYDIGGVINKGELLLYNTNVFKGMYVNNWYCKLASLPGTNMNSFPYGDKKSSFEDLEHLEPSKKYVAYVTLNKVVNYREFIELCKENNLYANWCKLCFKKDSENTGAEYYFNSNIGFMPYWLGGFVVDFDKEKYPYLTIDSTSVEPETSEEVMTQHVMSLMNYLADQDKFLKMMDFEEAKADMHEYVENIKKNGLCIYGFTMIGTKDDFAALEDVEEIEYITTKPVEYE